MGSGVSCGLSYGVGNSPLSIENYLYESKIKQILDAAYRAGFTHVQKAILRKLSNTIRDHLKESDYSGAKGDLEGNPIFNKKRGDYYQHMKEVCDGYRCLIKLKPRFENSLKNPILASDVRKDLEDGLKRVNTHLKRINDIFKPYGGIELWAKRLK